ncbi:hypothetical protein [Saccharothrix syringae]|uniref:Uncharacterized protein n=1 Tax=Saccharothrix syringae TaxID=103733 RepID=A0A5Q0GTY9_SACSY|nr:hypothetical protein [Saccharothrix syringae]QFZ17556.1 hypothetical protein EKG83_08740 [Saccharothrix syringae]
MVSHPVDLREPRRCVDCNADLVPTGHGPFSLVHEASCPVAMDDRAQRAADFAWLTAHPGEVRDREPSAGEREMIRMLGAPRKVVRSVRVQVSAHHGGRLIIFHQRGRALVATADVPRGGAA